MILAVPVALIGLAALPFVWWLHRKLRTPPEIELPSLMFLQDEADASKLPRGRRIDAELLLALTATALLAFAAAGPEIVQREPRRVVRVAIDVRTARPDARGYAERVLAARAAIAAAMDEADRLDIVSVPDARDAVGARRPTAAALLGAAQAGEASVRIVISDDAPPAETGGVQWIAVGDPEVENQGIVSISVRPVNGEVSVFATVANHGPTEKRLALSFGHISPSGPVESLGPELSIPPEGMRSQIFALPQGIERLNVRLVGRQGDPHEDAMPQDDGVLLLRVALLTYLDPGLPAPLARRIHRALDAILGADGATRLTGGDAVRAELAFLRRGAPSAARGAWVLDLEPIGEGAPALEAGAGTDALGRDALSEDLSTASAGWIYAADAELVAEGEQVLLARRGARRLWPVLLRTGRRLRLAPDPLRGEPAAIDTPFWPLLIENLVEAAGGRGIGGGYRATGVLDRASTRPGRARMPLDAARITAAPPSVPGRSRPLRPLLIGAALACLALLWAAPRIRRRFTARPALGVPTSR